MTDTDKARAVLYGLAIGDALGWPIEFLKMDKVTTIYGEEGIQEPPDPAEVTDETQVSMAVAEALIEAGDQDIDTLMAALTNRLIAWSNSPENIRAPGHTVTEAIRTLEAGVSWRKAGITHAKGNGSVVRMAPIGYFYQHHPALLREVAWAVGRATHSHPTAEASCIAAAYLIKLALDNTLPEDYIHETVEFIKGDAPDELLDALAKVEHVRLWTDEHAAMDYLGSGWIAEEAVTMAAYCAIRYAGDFPGAVRRAVNIAGDSDSVGCITGGLVAARLGLSGIPRDWINRLENLTTVTDVAIRLAQKKQAMKKSHE